ncbi:apyrase-like [Hermetia illucens]|uniref:apyrase-like n=1 Tax=Hermetia illucens TaxID=343691 RepID=UPI0018CC2FA2|nr:apyrase-like [Hermetia illucens]
MMFLAGLFLLALSGAPLVVRAQEDLFPVSIIHMNDFHARFEGTDWSSSPCSNEDECIGGYARVITVVKQLFEDLKESNPIYLNAGDNFQGTIWYNIGRWNVTQYFLNLVPADAITLGNHEFDHGVEGVVPFLETIKSPMIVANIDDSEEPTMQGKYNKSVIIDKYGRKIGVIGVILQTTYQIANTGKLKFLDESETVRAEAERLKNEHGVDIIIVLSHCGLEVDRIIAKNAGPLIDVIVGGHSHTFLYTGENPPGPDTPRDDYPVEVIQDDGHKVLIVQASCYTKYLGNITVYFDKAGEVVRYEGEPIFLAHGIPEDPDIVNELAPWKVDIDAIGKREVGKTRVTLSKSDCNYEECNLGSFINDAYTYSYIKSTPYDHPYWTTAAISVCNVGGIRTTLNKGALTYAHLVTTIPFGNTVDSFDIRGKYLLEALEYSVEKSYDEGQFSAANMLQVSGLRVTFNITKPVGERVVEVLVRCQKCEIPEYEPLELNKSYRVVTGSFLSGGGDGFTMFRDYKENTIIGEVDIDVFEEYVQKHSPITAAADERIIILR